MKFSIQEFYLPVDTEERFILTFEVDDKIVYLQSPLKLKKQENEWLKFSTLDEVLKEIARIDPKDQHEVILKRVNRYKSGII